MILFSLINMKLKAVPRIVDSKIIWAALVVFVFLTCCCGLTQAERKKKCNKKDVILQNPKDGICGAIDIRNNVTNFRKLENCTVIEGNVHISLIERTDAEEFDKYSFPLLTEITGHLMLFRVRNLRSLRTIFPSLAIIRGQDLFYNYALVAYEMRDLEEIGLINLRTIIRGGVRITKNKKLCHVDTVDWSRIAIGAESSEHHFMDNKEERNCANYCPDTCPTTVVDNVSAKRCWTSQHCQKNLNCNCNDNRTCMDNGTCCHKFCLGGCRGPLQSDCLGCKGVVYNNTCLPRCPPYTYMFSETRCLADKECLNVRNRTWNSETNSKLLKGEQNRCVVGDCPPGYMVAEEGELKGFECVKCKDFCPKVCNSTEVNSIQDLQRLKGCSKIIGPLVIQIMGGRSVAQEMEKNLGEIREVTGYINIRRSFALLHLYFFKKLEIIGGETLAHQGHSLIVMDNVNLQELFPKGQKIKIKRGQVAFHTNRRLCFYKIKNFVESLNLTEEPGPQDISHLTNGDLKLCSPEQMTLNVTQITHESAVLVWEKDLKDSRHLLTYNINYKEVPKDDSEVNIYLGRDACYDDVWMNKEQQPTEDNEPFQMGLLPKLKAYTKYAAYVQALVLTTTTHSAMTDIITFYTLPYYPSEPLNLEVSPTEDPTELHVKWKPPKYPNGVVTYYKLIYTKQPLDTQAFDRRNYCLEPLVETKDKGKGKVEEEQKKQNVSGNCCLCPKSKKELEKERDKRKMEVYFENHLQNNVYCKRFDFLPPKVIIDKNLTEQWENMNREDRLLSGNGEGGTVGSDMLKSMRKQGINMTSSTGGDGRMLANGKRKHSHTESIGDINVYDLTETIINNLEPFMEYVIEIQACHDTSLNTGGLCSNSRAISAGRTKALPIKDKVNETSITVEHVTNTTGDVIIRWVAPANPNGLILKYNLKYKRASQDNLVAQGICINRQMYKKMRGYRLTGLEPGNWTFQILAMSLTGKNSVTREKFFIIDQLPDETTDSKLYVVGAVIAFLILILIVLFIIIAVIKHRFRNGELTVISENRNYLNSSDLIDTMDGWEKDRDKIKLLEPLGNGSFGMVYKGIATGIRDEYPDEEMWVAVKTVNDRASFLDRRNFLKEASTMKTFDCYHVVKLLGVVSIGQPALVIMELMATDLKKYLRENRPEELDPGMAPPRIQDILQMAGEIADGMAYLSDRKFVHRDLAARNCMIAEDSTVKIGDFGMTRDIYETDYYRKGGRGMLPVRWMAPESLRDGIFTSFSDVWSYGVVLWEMVTLAAQPYQGLSNEEVVQFVSEGKTMGIPDQCPKQMETLMKRCWQRKQERPTFLDIIEFLEPYLNDKFKELSFYFSSGPHRSHSGDGNDDGIGESCSPHDVFDKDVEAASACLGMGTDLQCLSQTSLQHGMEGDNRDNDDDHEFCSDNLLYNMAPSASCNLDFSQEGDPHGHHHHHPRHEGGDCMEGLRDDYSHRYNCDDDVEDDDDESDSRCLMLGDDGCPVNTTTTTTGSCFSSSPLLASPLLEQGVASHPHPFQHHQHHHHHPSHEANQGLFELQPLIAPSDRDVEDSTSPVLPVPSTSPLPPPSSSSLSWNPHHNKSSLPSTSIITTSPINNNNNNNLQQQVLSSNCSPVSDYLGYNPSLSYPSSQTDPSTTHGQNTSPLFRHQQGCRDGGHQLSGASENNCRDGAGGFIPQQLKEQSPPPPPSASPSSSSSSLPSSMRGGESDKLLWPCIGSSNNCASSNNNNNSISRPPLRLPVLNQPPGGNFHRNPPKGGMAVHPKGEADIDKNGSGSAQTMRVNSGTTKPDSDIGDVEDGRLLGSGSSCSGNRSAYRDCDDDRVQPTPQPSSSLSSLSSSSHRHQSPPPPPPSSSSPQSPHPHYHHPHHSCDTSSSEGSKESTKSNKSSTGSHSSVPLMNGYTNGHAPPPPPPPPPPSSSTPSSSMQPRTAFC